MSDRLESNVGRLTRFSLDRRITVFVLLVTVIVVGLVAATGIPLELIPRGYENPFLGVVVPWNQSPAPEVQQKVTIPLEDELSTVRGVQRMTSYSRTGRAWVWLSFKYGTDMDVAYREVRDRVERARLVFPDDIERVFIRKHDESGIPVAAIGLAIDPSLTDHYTLIQNEVILPMSRIDGVANVEAEGLEQKEILIEIDRERMEASGLNIHSLSQQLSGDNFSLASGRVLDGSRKLLLRSVARFNNLDELKQRPVSTNVRLQDIATITYDEAEKNYSVRVNQKPAFAMMIYKEGQANTIEVSKRINDAVERARENPRLQGVEMLVLFSQGDVITDSLRRLFSSGRIGAVFAIGVLFFFLRRVRMTAIITLSIPISIIIALAVMYFAGETLNLLTLLALMICVGLLVDNSVVVAENIFRLHHDGVPRRDACIKGAARSPSQSRPPRSRPSSCSCRSLWWRATASSS